MTFFSIRMARGRALYGVLFAVCLVAAAATPHRPAEANTPAIAQNFQHLVNVADTTIGQLEKAIDETMKELDQIDETMHDRVEDAETTEAKVDAIEDRLEDKTSVDKDQIPGTDAKPQEIRDFLDGTSFFRPYFEKALKLRALLEALDAWKKLRKAWADTYKDFTGREVAQAPVGNVCNEARVAYAAGPVSMNVNGVQIPQTDITGDAGNQVAYLDLGLKQGGSFAAGQNLQMTATGTPAGTADASSWDIKASYDYSSWGKVGLSYSYSATPIDPDKTVSASFACPPQGTDVSVGYPVGGSISLKPGIFSGGTARVKTTCHKPANVDLDSASGNFSFDRFTLRGGMACPPDPETQRELQSDWQVSLGNQGIHVEPDSFGMSYIGANVGMGYCIAEWDRYMVDSNQCAADLSHLQFTRWEIAQPREGQPALVESRAPDRIQLAQAGPAARATARRITQLPNDRYFHSSGSLRAGLDDQWGLKRLGFAAAPPDGTGSLWPKMATPVLVAVVDSGIDASHPDLAGALWANPKEVAGNGKDDDRNGYVDDVLGWNFFDKSNNTWDNNGHGTFVAGIIAARTHDVAGIAGVNPWARILPVKVTDFDNKGDHLHITAGIYYAAQMGARVINVSIGGKRLTLGEQYAIDFAVKKGALVVVAAGNEGIDMADFSPAAVEGAITVAATDDRDRRAGFSNFGAKIDIAAPGVDILSLRARQTDLMAIYDRKYKPGSNIVGEDRMYYRLSGTSFAAPYVAGVASLLFSINPRLTPEQVKRMILQSARDIEVPGFDRLTGYGLLDARAALNADPDHFIDARISGVAAARKDGQVYVVPSGVAAADRLERAWIEVGKGKDPSEWVKASAETTKPVQGGPLALVPASHFAGPGLWTIRLIVEHADGSRREARHELNLR